MIQISLALLTLLILVLPLTAPQAQAVSPTQYIRKHCNPDTARLSTEMAAGLQDCLQTVYNFIVVIAVALAFIVIIWGAIEYLVGAAANTQQAGKEKIFNALIGLLIIFSSGVVLYWINPQIFSARLVLFKVTTLTAPGTVISDSSKESFPSATELPRGPAPTVTGPEKPTPPEAKLPQGVKGKTKRFTDVSVTHYYTPHESQKRFNEGSFEKEVKMEGSGKCEGMGKIRICKDYKGYINKQFEKISAPLDACNFRAIPRKTIAVPPEWWPSVVRVYLKDGSGFGTFFGTDRGQGVAGKHIDIYVGEGLDAFANMPDEKFVDVEVTKLKNCQEFKSPSSQ